MYDPDRTRVQLGQLGRVHVSLGGPDSASLQRTPSQRRCDFERTSLQSYETIGGDAAEPRAAQKPDPGRVRLCQALDFGREAAGVNARGLRGCVDVDRLWRRL